MRVRVGARYSALRLDKQVTNLCSNEAAGAIQSLEDGLEALWSWLDIFGDT